MLNPPTVSTPTPINFGPLVNGPVTPTPPTPPITPTAPAAPLPAPIAGLQFTAPALQQNAAALYQQVVQLGSQSPVALNSLLQAYNVAAQGMAPRSDSYGLGLLQSQAELQRLSDARQLLLQANTNVSPSNFPVLQARLQAITNAASLLQTLAVPNFQDSRSIQLATNQRIAQVTDAPTRSLLTQLWGESGIGFGNPQTVLALEQAILQRATALPTNQQQVVRSALLTGRANYTQDLALSVANVLANTPGLTPQQSQQLVNQYTTLKQQAGSYLQQAGALTPAPGTPTPTTATQGAAVTNPLVLQAQFMRTL